VREIPGNLEAGNSQLATAEGLLASNNNTIFMSSILFHIAPTK